jgi:hypothetical protein
VSIHLVLGGAESVHQQRGEGHQGEVGADTVVRGADTAVRHQLSCCQIHVRLGFNRHSGQ